MKALLDFDSCTYFPSGHKSLSFNTRVYRLVRSDDSQSAPQPADGTALAKVQLSDRPLAMHCAYVGVTVSVSSVQFSCIRVLFVFPLVLLVIKQTLEACWLCPCIPSMTGHSKALDALGHDAPVL